MSEAWEAQYAAGRHDVRWPWSDLVSLVMRHAKPQPGARVLELGPGTGANVPFFVSLGCEYVGVEQSPTAHAILADRFSIPRFYQMDFTRLLPDGPFDLVVDRASLPHNTTEAIARCIRMIEKRLRPGGWFIGVDWFSTDDTARERFADLGTVTFFTSQDIETLLHETRWEIVHLDQVRRETLGTGRLVSTFNFAARLR